MRTTGTVLSNTSVRRNTTESLSGDPLLRTERIENAGDVTIGGMTRQLGLEQYDRICYLYDYGDEWRFYAILKEVLSDEPSDKEPDIVKEKGDPINDQYDPPEPVRAILLPDPLYSVLPETAVPVADLRELEERSIVSSTLFPLLSLETGFGAVCERFLVQFEGHRVRHRKLSAGMADR